MENSKTCPLMRLPTELRLLIYGYALHDTPAITVGTLELVGSHPDIVHRLYGNRRNPFPGIPLNHEPVIEPQYNASLLSITKPAVILLPPAIACPLEEHEPYSHLQHSAHHSLLLVNKRIKEEVTGNFKLDKNRPTSLFVSYPHGLHVLRTLAPGLMKQARTLHLAGVYTPDNFDPSRGVFSRRMDLMSMPPAKLYNGNVVPNTANSLETLITSIFGPKPTHYIDKLDLRIYYPGEDSYSTVWGDDNSPAVVALRSIYAGEIAIEVWRGLNATGVYLTAGKPMLEDTEGREEGLKKRVVSTVWRRLEEGRVGEPSRGSWVVDPRWPEWDEEYEMSEGPRGDLIVTTGR